MTPLIKKYLKKKKTHPKPLSSSLSILRLCDYFYAPVSAGMHVCHISEGTLHKVINDDTHDRACPLKLPARHTRTISCTTPLQNYPE